MEYFSSYIFLLFVLKFIFIIMAISNIYLKFKHRENTEVYKTFLYWKGRVEFVFVSLMALLLIYLFNPRKNRLFMIDGETKLLLYLFGFVLLITADWSNFIHESKWFQRVQDIVG